MGTDNLILGFFFCLFLVVCTFYFDESRPIIAPVDSNFQELVKKCEDTQFYNQNVQQCLLAKQQKAGKEISEGMKK